MYELPITIEIGDKICPIRDDGDYRMVLDCFIVLQDLELADNYERVLSALIIFYEDLDVDSALQLSEDELTERVQKMYDFFECGQDNTYANKHDYKLMDWEQDAQLVVSAINNVAGKEIRAEKYIHWWTFMGYYMSIGESAFSTVVSIRYKIITGKKLEKYERDFKNDNPQYFIWNRKSIEEQEAEQYIRELWNQGNHT